MPTTLAHSAAILAARVKRLARKVALRMLETTTL